MAEEQDLATSLRTGCEWLAGALTDIAEATAAAKDGGLPDVARALNRIGAALERQASQQSAALIVVAEAIEGLTAAGERQAAAAERQAVATERQAQALEWLGASLKEGREKR